MIPVTRTFLPDINEYSNILKRAWNKKWITNRGELVLELEAKLKDFLNVNNIIITNNGTIPLQIAVKLLGNGGEVITTPFSYVATTSSIVWENCKPIFVDIHPDYLTIDEKKIENAITEKTTAIMATHVFGNPCDIETIQEIALKHNLKVIYDAAHCFGVKYKNSSIFNFGDVSTCSFHATKLFHTGEGGAMFCNNETLNHKLFYSHNFGHNGTTDFFGLGINGKISELQAAMGLTVFQYIQQLIRERKEIINYYNVNLDLTQLQKLKLRENTEWNYSYYPIIFQSEKQLLQKLEQLNSLKIFPRRYFYPSLNTLNYIRSEKMPISESISNRILCLPIFNGLTHKEQNLIINTLNKQ